MNIAAVTIACSALVCCTRRVTVESSVRRATSNAKRDSARGATTTANSFDLAEFIHSHLFSGLSDHLKAITILLLWLNPASAWQAIGQSGITLSNPDAISARLSSAALMSRGDDNGKESKGWETRPAFPEFAQNLEEKDNNIEQQPWDAVRFFQQSSKFVQLPNLFAQTVPKILQPGDVMWSPNSPSSGFQFSPLDDVVMGGASESTFDENTGTWMGSVTAANNGGFINIRSTPFEQPLDMSACSGIELKLSGGNGRRFKLLVRDSTDFNGVGWTSSFDARVQNPLESAFSKLLNQGSSFVVRIPFESQIPTIFAKTVPDQVFDRSSVVGLQLAYSKFEYDGDLNTNFELGDVSLQVQEVRAY